MQKVVTISLNGNSYQLEEPGFNLLRSYLDRAETRLKDSPDRGEVLGDLEQAIGEKCRGMLGPHKTVVSTTEVERIIAEMGPVESADEKAADAAAERGAAERRPPRPAPTPQAPVQDPRRRDVGRRVQRSRRVHGPRRDLGAHRPRRPHAVHRRACCSSTSRC